jgi:hypothetical protein
MNTDTGELRAFTKEQLAEVLERGEPWVPVTPSQAKRLAPLPPEERPAVLRKWDAAKQRKHDRAVARERSNRTAKGKRP